MTGVPVGQAAGREPGAARRIVEFGVGAIARSRGAARSQHLSVRQKRRGMEGARVAGTSGEGPGPAAWIVKFRTQMVADNEDLAVSEKGRGGRLPVLMQTAGVGPGMSFGIVKLGAGEDGI